MTFLAIPALTATLATVASAFDWLVIAGVGGAAVYYVQERNATNSLAQSTLSVRQSRASAGGEFAARLELESREAEIARRVEQATQSFLSSLVQKEQQIERQAEQNKTFRQQLEQERELLEKDKLQLTEYETQLQRLFQQATEERALANEEMSQVRADREGLNRDRFVLESAKAAHALQVSLDKAALTEIARQLLEKSKPILETAKSEQV